MTHVVVRNTISTTPWEVQNVHLSPVKNLNKKAQLSLTNPRDACEKFARFT